MLSVYAHGMADEQEDDALTARVSDWVERSGRALELRVARAFARQHADMSQARLFTDPVTSDQREADVVARWTVMIAGGRQLSLVCVCECKAGADKPWVLFDDGRSRFPERPARVIDHLLTHEHLNGVTIDMAPFEGAWLEGYPFDEHLGIQNPVSHAIATALEQDKPNQPNSAWRAARQVMSACYGLLADFSEKTPQLATVMVPVIVTEAPLFRVYLNRAGEAQTERVIQGVLVTQSHDGGSRRAIFVMNEKVLQGFAAELRAVIQRIALAG